MARRGEVHLIANARIKTDVIDVTVFARLYARRFLPEVWVRQLLSQLRAYHCASLLPGLQASIVLGAQ